jgi:hypothetical protein
MCPARDAIPQQHRPAMSFLCVLSCQTESASHCAGDGEPALESAIRRVFYLSKEGTDREHEVALPAHSQARAPPSSHCWWQC